MGLTEREMEFVDKGLENILKQIPKSKRKKLKKISLKWVDMSKYDEQYADAKPVISIEFENREYIELKDETL